jgi:predicted nuclease with TOPRIM domain
MQSLAILESNLEVLLTQYHDLQQQVLNLQQENDNQREEMMRTHAELVQLKEDYKHLETAHALLVENIDDEHRDRAKQRLSNIIAQVERAIEVLTK